MSRVSTVDFFFKSSRFPTLSHRIVHLDLKGAPLKVTYLDRVIPLIKAWGATGILLEWEDTFPYTGELVEVGSRSNAGGDNMYSLAEVRHIINLINSNGMEPIQLVQTMGHMEYVLKHPKYQELQEVIRSPAVLCPCRPKSKLLVKNMIDQILEVQHDAKFIHIGADEVWHTGICPLCKEKAMNHKLKESSLFMDHIQEIVQHIKQKRPDITVLMWDDMLRRMSWEVLEHYLDLGNSVIPVLWNYNGEGSLYIPQTLMDAYGHMFPQVWFGTAFKGANGSCQVLSPASRYLSNHTAWIMHASTKQSRINYTGVIVTGWSRYDHYATLCEMLPSALPSLAGCLRLLTTGEHNEIEKSDEPKFDELPSDQWPGEDLARCVHTFTFAKERCLSLLNGDLVNTWLNPWQMFRKYTVPGHVEGIAVAAQHSFTELQVIRANMNTYLQEITGERSTEEWLMTNIDPLSVKINEVFEKARERAVCVASVKPDMPDSTLEPDVDVHWDGDVI